MLAFAQNIVETVRHPLLILDLDLRVRKGNAAFYRTFNVTEAETDGRLVYDLGGGRFDIPQLRTQLEEVIHQGGSFEDFEVRLDSTHLGLKVMLLDAHLVTRDDGAPMILLAVEDITDRVRAREELHRLNLELEDRVRERTAQLEATNRELEAFCYSVSHDLRAPLRALDGFSAELLRSFPGRILDESGQHYLRRLRAGTQRMGQLIDDLLQLSRLSRGEMTRERVDVTALAGAIAAELRDQEPGRQMTFVVQPGLTVVGDGSLLRIVLENLLGNAWKFTGKNTQATIEVGRAEHESETAFFVRDDGAGFDMKHASKLFGAFQRLHAEREFPGNGIGLATVQRIIHRHDGQVWAEGTPEKGATFYFTVPMKESP